MSMNSTERRAVASLALLYATRMLGLFMVYPIFKIYAPQFSGATSAAMIGFAMSGAYGWVQALLQIPFGLMSDRFGRKPMIIIGLSVFALGSIVAALSTSIEGVIIGRALQGSGAIGGTVLAMLADLTREEQRTKAMAIIGISIGLSVSVAMVLGSVLGHAAGLNGVFWFTAAMAIAGLIILVCWVPTPIARRTHRDVTTVPSQLWEVIRDQELLRFNWGIFVVHFIFAANFNVLPMILGRFLAVPSQGWLYLAMMVAAFVAMIPFMIVAEKKRRIKPIFVGAILLLSAAEVALSQTHGSLLNVTAVLFLFFMAFNLLEATLPSLVSKTCPAGLKGTAMSLYSCCQFLGVGCGGLVGGWVLDRAGIEGVLWVSSGLAFIWFGVGLFMANPKYLSSYVLKLRDNLGSAQEVSDYLAAVVGVEDVVVVLEDQVAYLKVDNQRLDKQALGRYSLA